MAKSQYMLSMALTFPCHHKTHGPYYDLMSISALSPWRFSARPYHVRSKSDVQWQKVELYLFEKQDHGYCCLQIQHLTNSTNVKLHPSFCYQIAGPTRERDDSCGIDETVLIDEVDKKLYLVHVSGSGDKHFIIRQFSVEINKKTDQRRYIENPQPLGLYLGRFHLKNDQRTAFQCRGYISGKETDIVRWFLNPFDGSIFQISCYFIFSPPHSAGPHTIISYYTVSWLKLDGTVQIEAPHAVTYDGKVKEIGQCKFEFDKQNFPDHCIIFGNKGQKLLLRFRLPNFESIVGDFSGFVDNERGKEMKDFCDSIDSDNPYVSEMTKPPIYVLFGLDYQSNTIEILSQFKPTSYESNCDLLVSSRLLSFFGGYIGFPNSKAASFLCQRTMMIGQFLKYTFFSALHKNKMAILAVKSVPKTLQNGHHSLTPKKLWFPMEDDKFKEAFQKLSHIIKWEMLAIRNNYLFVTGREFVLEVFNRQRVGDFLNHLATVRVKLVDTDYKDYRKCAQCGKVEEYKRRSKNGKRIAQFKVCGWCKDHNLHKLWWEQPCHYCSEKCADDHWPKHKLEHKQPIKVKISKGKKKK